MNIAVIGLGYVGLPLAIHLARKFDVLGYDVSTSRVQELSTHWDRTGEVAATDLEASSLRLTSNRADIADADVHIVTVPTPVKDGTTPDLSAVLSACETVGQHMKKGATVVFESTVYPGVTEDICGPVLAEKSGLKPGVDFFLGYSPERINPGDKHHTVDRITKVVAGQTPATEALLRDVYGAVNNGDIFIARDIRTAEAAKVIENAQRDINIAFVNELAMIFSKAGISTHDVLAAANTKWNFLPFTPGLVGGHCIGIDPYYLADFAQKLGHDPEVILSGRRINEHMPKYIAEGVHQRLGAPGKILVLGLTFKENVPDIRNSKSVDMVTALQDLGHDVFIHDPHADPDEAKREFGCDLLANVDDVSAVDCIIGAVQHDEYISDGIDFLMRVLRDDGLLVDIKNMWRGIEMPETIRRWDL